MINIMKWLDANLERYLLIVFSIVMVIVIFTQVVMRYLFDNSLAWSEELARYCFIWLVYIGVSYGVKEQRHIKIDLVLIRFKEKGRILLSLLSNLLFLSFALYIVVFGAVITEAIMSYGQSSPSLQIPMGIIYLAAPIGMGLTSIRLLQQMIKQVRTLMGTGSFEVKTEKDEVLEDVGLKPSNNEGGKQ